MDKLLAWENEQYDTEVAVAVLMIPLLFSNWNDKHVFPIKRNGIRLPYSSQNRMHPMAYGSTSSLKQIRSLLILLTSCHSILELCNSFFDFVKRGIDLVDEQISIQQAHQLETEQLLKVLSPTSYLPTHALGEAAICCSDILHSRGRLALKIH